MTPIEQWNAMTPRKQDAWIEINLFGRSESKMWPGCVKEGAKAFPPRPFTSDISAAMEAEEKIMQMDDETKIEYMESLWKVLNIPTGNEGNWDSILRMVHASAADRCKAMYLTLNQRREEI
jgi:hypothetical protein